jgi:hypothetical protein
MNHREELFDTEAKLRLAALAYAQSRNDDTRKSLREAAIAFADVAIAIDEACEKAQTS